MSKATETALLQPVVDIRTACFRDSVEFSTDESRDCEEAGCCGPCTCAKINRAWVTSTESVGPQSLKLVTPIAGKKSAPRYQPSQIEAYCIQRLMVHHECYAHNSYDLNITRGYYGEEVGRVEFIHLDALSQDIHEMLALLTDHAKVMYVLNKEYGYIAPEVRATDAVELLEIKLDNIQPRAGVTMIKRPKNYLYKLQGKSAVGVVMNGVLLDGHQRYAYLLGAEGGSLKATYINLYRDGVGHSLAYPLNLGGI